MEIKELRKRYNLTQTKLAQELGVTSRTVQNWEAGKVIPDNMQIAIDMLADKYETVSHTHDAKSEADTKRRYLPLIPFGAIAGFPAGDNMGVALKDCAACLRSRLRHIPGIPPTFCPSDRN